MSTGARDIDTKAAREVLAKMTAGEVRHELVKGVGENSRHRNAITLAPDNPSRRPTKYFMGYEDAAGYAFLRNNAASWLDEIDRLAGIIAQHELCHDQHGKVNAEDFANSCAAEQRKIYGCAPHADRLAALTANAAAAVQVEREACAKIAESSKADYHEAGRDIAETIIARTPTTPETSAPPPDLTEQGGGVRE